MWEKIKEILACIGTFFVSLLAVWLYGRYSDREGKSGTDDADKGISGGIERIKDRLDGAEEIAERSSDRAEQCASSLARAEEILRNAAERSKKK